MTNSMVVHTPRRETPEEMLRPLLIGQSVSLVVNDPAARKSRRVDKVVAMIAPLSLYGYDSQELLISVPGHGAQMRRDG